MTFGESLTGIRKEKGISRKDFADQLQIPYTTLRNYETDQREPGHKLLIKMAVLLHVSVDELIGYHAEATKESPDTAEAAPGDTLRSTLLHNFDQLNQEGREKLVDFSDDMVATGKYIKSDPDKLGKAKDF